MKRAWIAACLLLIILAGTLAHSVYLTGFTQELSGLLEKAEDYAESGDWATASDYNQKAHRLWEERGVYLHLLLRHEDTDEIYMSFHEVEEFLECQEAGEYSAANAKLIAQLFLLSEAEQLNLKNVL